MDYKRFLKNGWPYNDQDRRIAERWRASGHKKTISLGQLNHIRYRLMFESRRFGSVIAATAEWFPNDPDPDPVADVRDWRGNFLAKAPNWEMGNDRQSDCGLFYPRFDTAKRARFRADYTAAGYTHLPLTVMRNAQPARKLRIFVDEFKQSGMVLCHKIFTDARGKPLPNDFAVAERYVRDLLPQFADEPNIVNSIAWEMPSSTAGSGDPIGDPPRRWGWMGDGASVLKMAKLILALAPKQPLYVHWLQDWWGPAVMDEEVFCKKFKALGGTGVLFQSRWRSSDADVYEQAFEVPRGRKVKGVCGRVEASGLDFVWFEFARHGRVHARRLKRYANDGRGRGSC